MPHHLVHHQSGPWPRVDVAIIGVFGVILRVVTRALYRDRPKPAETELPCRNRLKYIT